MPAKQNVLVTGLPVKGHLKKVLRYANVFWLSGIGEGELDRLLPTIDCILVQTWWPDSLTPERVARMRRLRFVQSGMAGVNHIPFHSLGRDVVVSSNAGGFSTGVAEFALALMLASAKKVVMLDHSLRTGEFDKARVGELFRLVSPMKGMSLGILGYGGIGKAVGSMGRNLGMRVIAFSRRPETRQGVSVYSGSKGLSRVLSQCDFAVIALPLSKLTTGLIGAKELAKMKSDATLVNVARAEIVDEAAMYRHLVRNPRFTYATDVWRIEGGKETYSSRFPFLKLPNFIGTPHVAGGSAAVTGAPGAAAVENLLRYLKESQPLNVVDPSEYA